MNKKIKVFLMLFVLFALFTMFSTLNVSAKSIILEDNDNPDYVTVLSIDDESYTIEIDDETKIGYIVKKTNDTYEILGTCKVIIFDITSKNVQVMCNSLEENNLGEIEITITGTDNIITSIQGDVNNIVDLYSKVEIIE